MLNQNQTIFMKSKIFAIAISFLAFSTLSSFAPMSVSPTVSLSVSVPSANNAVLSTVSDVTPEKSSDITNPKADKKAKKMEKLLNSKAGKWLIAKMQKSMEKRHVKLSKKLAIAEKAGDTKKVDKIKKKMDAKAGNLKQLAKFLIVGGLICMLVGLLFGFLGYGYNNGSYGAGGFFWALGTLAVVVGLIILLLAYLDVI